MRLSGAFDPATEGVLTEARVTYGIELGDQVLFIGEEPATFSEDGSGRVTGQYDLTMLTVSDGENTVSGYLDLEVDEAAGVQTIEVPMAYYADDNPVGEPESVLLHVTADGTKTWDSSDEDPPLAADADWQIDVEPLPPTTPLVAQLVLTDYGGNEAAISASFVVP